MSDNAAKIGQLVKDHAAMLDAALRYMGVEAGFVLTARELGPDGSQHTATNLKSLGSQLLCETALRAMRNEPDEVIPVGRAGH